MSNTMATSNLRTLVGEKLINEMLRRDSVRQKDRSWKVLIMDRLATRIISASCKMHDIMSEGITIVEDIMKSREPLAMFDAIYFIQPNETSVTQLINDFDRAALAAPKYKAAHVFFTEGCNDELFTRLNQSKCAKYIKTLVELNIAFLPYERLVYSLDSPDTFCIAYEPSRERERTTHFAIIAEQIATLCTTLGEYPTIRFRSESEGMAQFAEAVSAKLDKYKNDNPTMGEGGDKGKSVLLLLDRGFDPVSPLIHELTYQAMAYDFLKIENDIFEYDPNGATGASSAPQRKAILDENDELWTELRHQYIGAVLQSIPPKLRELAKQNRMKDMDRAEPANVKSLALMIKKYPQYQKELSAYGLHSNIAQECSAAYNRDSLEKICSVEQTLATGIDENDEALKDPMRDVLPLLMESNISADDKLRLIMLYVLYKNGITDENLNRFLNNVTTPLDKKNIILNMQHLNLQIIQDPSRAARRKNIPQPRKQRPAVGKSRWTPYVKDLMENVIEQKLDTQKFPSIGGQRNTSASFAAQSTRPFGDWMHNRGGPVRSGPRLIVFILGGASYSELRCAYEVTQSNPKWEVLIGSDHIMTPKQFLHDLEMRPPKTGGQ